MPLQILTSLLLTNKPQTTIIADLNSVSCILQLFNLLLPLALDLDHKLLLSPFALATRYTLASKLAHHAGVTIAPLRAWAVPNTDHH